MVKTKCSNCFRMTSFKEHNAPDYWYCQYCSSPIELKSLANLAPNKKTEALNKFPQTTHFIEIEGEVKEGGEVVLKLPSVSSKTNKKASRKNKDGILLFRGKEKLGELAVEAH